MQSQIQDEKVRVAEKKKDDLQTVIPLLRQQSLGGALQFENFRG